MQAQVENNDMCEVLWQRSSVFVMSSMMNGSSCSSVCQALIATR